MALNPQNLRTPTSEEARKIGELGGKASVESRKRRKSIAETWEAIKDLPMKPGEVVDIDQVQNLASLKGANLTVEQAMLIAVAQKVFKTGDAKTATTLMRYFDGIKAGEIAKAKAEKEIAKLELERRKLELELAAFEEAVKRSTDGKVVIVDDIPNDKAD